MLPECHDRLHPGRQHERKHNCAAVGELRDPGRREIGDARSHLDSIEGNAVGGSRPSVTRNDCDTMKARGREVLSCLCGDLGIEINSRDGASVTGKLRKNGGVVAGSRANLQDPVTGRDIEQLGHVDHDSDFARRANGPAFAILLRDDGVAAIDAIEAEAGQERFARDAAKCLFYPRT